MRLIFIIDSPAQLKPQKDSTVALMRAAARAGDEVYISLLGDWYLQNDGVRVTAQQLQIAEEHAPWYTVKKTGDYAAGFFDVIFLRKEPPVDTAFITTTLLLDTAAAMGTLVVNAPRALREYNEKLSIYHFPQHIVPTLVSAEADRIVDFHAVHGGAVIKPLNGMGGQGVYISPAKDKNVRAVIDLVSNGGRDFIMTQAYLPAAREGDNRVFVINGRPASWMLTRLPRDDDHRGNMAAGGRAEARSLSKEAQCIAETVGPVLQTAGIVFAGLDVIGTHLTEINITCPTGLREVRDQTGKDLAQDVLEAVQTTLARI